MIIRLYWQLNNNNIYIHRWLPGLERPESSEVTFPSVTEEWEDTESIRPVEVWLEVLRTTELSWIDSIRATSERRA